MIKRSLLIPLVLASSTLLPLLAQAQQYQETDLVANTAGAGAKFVDPKLIDPWGIARSSSGPWWVNDRGSGVATLYDGEGKAQPLVVTVPHQVQTPPLAGPTGIVFNVAFDALTGRFQDKLRRQDNSVISIPGLWAITFGAGNSNSGAPNQLFFDAGDDKGGGGVFGFLAPVASDLTQGNDQ
jgi:hypothetical protein